VRIKSYPHVISHGTPWDPTEKRTKLFLEELVRGNQPEDVMLKPALLIYSLTLMA
jgi:hypothetical protein